VNLFSFWSPVQVAVAPGYAATVQAVAQLTAGGQLLSNPLIVPTRSCIPGEVTMTDQCSPCSAGTYSNVTAATTCTSCPTGYYAPVTGLSKCLFCPRMSQFLSIMFLVCSLMWLFECLQLDMSAPLVRPRSALRRRTVLMTRPVSVRCARPTPMPTRIARRVFAPRAFTLPR
jgi:hypothetical protein